jgi:hypothetical protein
LFKSESSDAKSRLEACIAEIREWMITNKLKLNDDKSEFLVLSSKAMKNEVQNLSLVIGEETLQSSVSVRNLGVIFDCLFSMDDHITSICKASHFHLRNIGAIRQYLTQESAATVIHAFVTSRLDYCNGLLGGLYDKQLHRLRRIQNHAARITTLTHKYDNITPVLKSLHWLPVHLRIDFKILLITYKIVNGSAPSYLEDLISPYVPMRSLRSSEEGRLAVPRSRTVTYGDRAYSINGPRLWNDLPLSVKESPSTPTFKANLKAHLFKKF